MAHRSSHPPHITRRAFTASAAAALSAVACRDSLAVEAQNSQEFRPTDADDFPRLDWQRDWPWWRGPLRNGHTPPACRLPTKFGERERLVWKTPIPGRGHSSPVVVGDVVYLTTADELRETQSLLALSRTSGELLWSRQLNEGGFAEENHPKNSEANPTIACDGERIIACLNHHEAIHVTALHLAGETLWTCRTGHYNPRRYKYGYAPSPVMYRQLVIVAAEQDGESYIVALNRSSGEEVWRIARPQSTSYSSPSIGHVAGRDQLMISGHEHIAAYDPSTGEQLWRAPDTTAATCGTMVWSNDIALASGGYPKAETVAVKADGSGKVLWKNGQQCYEQSMIVVSSGDDPALDYLYAITDKGIAYCWRVSDGKEMWRERLRGPVSASPIVAGGHIYWANESGTMYVFAADPAKFRLIAENRVGEEALASPAVSRNELFLRVAQGVGASRKEYLYCFG